MRVIENYDSGKFFTRDNMQKPNALNGLRHVALNVKKLEECVNFYTKLLGMKIVWQPDADNIYLSSGHDNFALHRIKSSNDFEGMQHLDHIGFVINEIDEVDRWYVYLRNHNVVIQQEIKNHRDGARSFYCLDPDKNVVQFIHHPELR